MSGHGLVLKKCPFCPVFLAPKIRNSFSYKEIKMSECVRANISIFQKFSGKSYGEFCNEFDELQRGGGGLLSCLPICNLFINDRSNS